MISSTSSVFHFLPPVLLAASRASKAITQVSHFANLMHFFILMSEQSLAHVAVK